MADVLEVQELIRVKLLRNGSTLYEQVANPTAVTYTRHASDRLVLAANMANFQEASLGSINSTNPGKHVFVVADRSITIAANTTAQQVVGDTLMMRDTSISHLYFKNTDANNTATVQFVVTDQNA